MTGCHLHGRSRRLVLLLDDALVGDQEKPAEERSLTVLITVQERTVGRPEVVHDVFSVWMS